MVALLGGWIGPLSSVYHNTLVRGEGGGGRIICLWAGRPGGDESVGLDLLQGGRQAFFVPLGNIEYHKRTRKRYKNCIKTRITRYFGETWNLRNTRRYKQPFKL